MFNLSKCKLPPPPEKGSSNRRQTLGSSLLPCFPRSGFTGKKCKKSDPKRFCYCCCALTFPSLVNVFPESILFCPSFSFGNTCLCMCMLVYITCTHSYIYNCVQACADKTDSKKTVFKNELFIRKEVFIRINCADLSE